MTLQDAKRRLMLKLLSGRWVLTVLCGIAFIYCIVTKQLESATITAILTMVFQSYFNRKDRSDDKLDKTQNPK